MLCYRDFYAWIFPHHSTIKTILTDMGTDQSDFNNLLIETPSFQEIFGYVDFTIEREKHTSDHTLSIKDTKFV